MARVIDDSDLFSHPGGLPAIRVDIVAGDIEIAIVGLKNVAGTQINPATEDTLSTIDGKITVCNTGAVTISTPLPAGTNIIGGINIHDGIGTPLTSTLTGGKQALDVNVAGATGGIDPIGLKDIGGATIDPAEEHILATSPHAVRLTDGTAFYQAATETTLALLNGKVVVCNTGNIAGTVTANQGGSWDINNITGTISLPTGAATAANQVTANASLATIAGNTTSIDGKITTCNTNDTRQGTHDNLNANANIQVGDSDVSDTNPVPTKEVAISNSDDYYSDDTIQAMGTSPTWQAYSFGFTALNMILANDEPGGGGAKDFELSFDSGTTVHGTVKKGETVEFLMRRRTAVHLRGASPRTFRLFAWG